MKLLVARGLTKRFGGIVANKSVDFEIDRGEIHGWHRHPNVMADRPACLVSGGVVVPDQGSSIVFDGRDVTMLPIHRRAQLGLGRCYQVSRVFLDHTIITDNVISAFGPPGAHLRIARCARRNRVARSRASRPRRCRTCGARTQRSQRLCRMEMAATGAWPWRWLNQAVASASRRAAGGHGTHRSLRSSSESSSLSFHLATTLLL